MESLLKGQLVSLKDNFTFNSSNRGKVTCFIGVGRRKSPCDIDTYVLDSNVV